MYDLRLLRKDKVFQCDRVIADFISGRIQGGDPTMASGARVCSHCCAATRSAYPPLCTRVAVLKASYMILYVNASYENRCPNGICGRTLAWQPSLSMWAMPAKGRKIPAATGCQIFLAYYFLRVVWRPPNIRNRNLILQLPHNENGFEGLRLKR